MKKKSVFTGSAWGILGWQLLISFSASLFLIPLAFVVPEYMRWFVSHTEIDGRKLKYDTGEPYWGVIGWTLFSMITLGFGSFYASKKITAYLVSHVKFEDDENAVSEFTGSAWSIFGYSIITGLLAWLLFIPLAFIITSFNKWAADNIIISGKRLVFTYDDVWWGIVGWMFFSVITFGFGSFYATKKILQWSLSYTELKEAN